MRCVAISPWGAPCLAEWGHGGDHLPGPVPPAAPIVHQSASIAAYRSSGREAARTAVGRAPVPIVLVPTPAQRAAGRRIVDARDDQMPAAARRLRDAVLAAGNLVRVSYAHALMPPKRGGEDWWDNHAIAVRVGLADGSARGWGVWSNGRWDAGQWWTLGEMLRAVGARELVALATASVVLDASLDSQARELVGSAA